MDAHVAIWIVTLATWAILLFNSFRLGLLPKFPLVFTLILSSMLFEASMPWLAVALDSKKGLYTSIYMVTVTINVALAAIVLLSIYSVLGKIGIRSGWHLVVVPALIFGLTLSGGSNFWTFSHFLDAAPLIVTYLGVVTMARSRRKKKTIQLGWNLKMVLLAVTVAYVFQFIVFAAYRMGLPLSYDSLILWLQGSSLAGWIILAVGMIEYSPPTPVVAGNSESGQTNGDSGRERTVGNLSETREQLC